MQIGRQVINKALHIIKLVIVMMNVELSIQPQIMKMHKLYLTSSNVFTIENASNYHINGHQMPHFHKRKIGF